MHVMVVMVVMMVVMVVMHGSGHRGGRSGLLRDGVSGEAKRENRRGGKGLDHWKSFLWLANPDGSTQAIETSA
jgi:hypothetical protein